MRIPAAALSVLLAAAPALALSQQEAKRLFQEANELFREANELSLRDPNAAVELYQRAALRYERLVRDGGIRNGKLFYNLGNAYFKAQDIGRAILNYRRAERYIPGDPNLEQNLAYVRSRLQDRFEAEQRTQVLRTLLFFHYDFPPGLRLALLAVFSGLFWGLAAVRLFRREWAPGWALAALAAAGLLMLGSLAAEATAAEPVEGVILSPQVVARKGDGESYEPSFTEPLHAGTEFRLIEERNGWYRIELPDGRTCWIPTDAAGLVPRI